MRRAPASDVEPAMNGVAPVPEVVAPVYDGVAPVPDGWPVAGRFPTT